MIKPSECYLQCLLRLSLMAVLAIAADYSTASSFETGKLTVHSLYLEGEPGNDRTFSSLRDHDGYLWVATDNGLKRYDGYRYHLFKSEEGDPSSIGSNAVMSLLLQENGTLWVGGGSLNEYLPATESFNVYEVSQGASIWSMYQDEQGILWLGGEGFGLRGFDLEKREVVFEFFSESDGRYINAIAQRGFTSSIWVASNAGLYLFDTRTHRKQKFEIPADFASGVDHVQGLAEDNDGNLWIAAQDGLIVLNPNTRGTKKYTSDPSDPNSLMTNTLRSVFKDSKGQIWVGTDKRGVEKYLPQTDSFLHFPSSEFDPSAFPSGSIDHIMEDGEGNLWFSSAVYGLRRISANLEKFVAFKHSEKDETTLGFNNVFDLLEDKQGNIWIATDGGGLDKFNPKTNVFSHYRHDPNDPGSISSNSVLSLAEDAEGNIWIGTWVGGLNKLNPNTGVFTHFTRDTTVLDGQTLGNNNIFRIEPDAQGRLYLSPWRSGMQIFDPSDSSFTTFSPISSEERSGISNVSINDFHIASNGIVWIGGYDGLEYYNPEKQKFTKVNLPGVEAILDIYQDKENTLWLATSKNLMRYDIVTEELRAFNVEDGLANDFVTSIEADDQGYLWLGTRHGINRFDPITESFETFDEADGLAGPQFNKLSHLFTRDGLMFFGGSSGLSVFSPKYLPRNPYAPQVHLTDLEFFQVPAKVGPDQVLKKHINLTEELTISYNLRDITFEFTALNFISPNKNRYKYRLKGWDSDWVEVGSDRRRVRYTNLDSGLYTFQVLGSNNEGVWGAKPKELRLIVLSPWWQTWWAKIAFGVLSFLLIYTFIYWRLWLAKSRQKLLEQLVKRKTAELENANTTVSELNSDLEKRVNKRTKELSVEIEERRLAEAKLFHMAFHDTLTGLPNRSWLIQHLETLIDRSSGDGSCFSLFFLDGDRFKKVNDTHGHLIGDMLLKAAAERLAMLMPLTGHAVRLGGDEFTVVLDEIESEEQIYLLADDIIQAFSEPFVLDQNQVHFRMSVGMLVCSNEYSRPDQILRDADIAMYRAKENGRGSYQMFDSRMLESTLDVAELEADLFRALEDQQFKVEFQPIINLSTDVLVGYEVLLRWHHPERGLITPCKFIPIAEDVGVIFDIGLWVLGEACRQQKLWTEATGGDFSPSIAVNLSPLQLDQPQLIQKIDKVFKEHGVQGHNIKLEITESALMENTETVDQLLGALRERGIELAIDDFGTGYSSLSYLGKLPVQVLKIDRSFVDALCIPGEESSNAEEIIKATISLAHNLNIEVVAEGIETEEQMAMLKRCGCDYGQGFFIAPPLSASDATDFLFEHSPMAYI